MVLKGLIFDFDGLILDTEIPGCNAWAEIFEMHGHTFTVDDWKKAIGSGPSAYDPALHLQQLTGRKLDVNTLNAASVKRSLEMIEDLPTLPGVREFIQAGKNAGLALAVASSSSRDWVEGHLNRLGLRQFFDVVCTADDVANVKPDPALFLLAAEKIGCEPSEVVVFEDSPNGITAANRAGMPCIAVPNEITRTMDTSHASAQVDSFLQVDLTRLAVDHAAGWK